MSNIITVRKNWKKKIRQLCEGNPTVTIYSLNNNFIGKEYIPKDMLSFVENNNNNPKGSRLIYNKDTGACTLHVHSNLWYLWTKKINW